MATKVITLATVATVVVLGLAPLDPGWGHRRIFTRVKNGATVPAPARVPAEWWVPTSARLTTGSVSYYGPGLMAKVAANRGLGLAGYVGGVALMRRGDLGRVVWLRPGAGPWVGPFRVVDCAGPGHYAGLVKRGRVAEVSRAVWLELGLPEMPVPVVIWFESRAGGPAR